jgi:hypothetical protein
MPDTKNLDIFGSETTGPVTALLSAIAVLRRAWSLCSKWKNPSRAHGWRKVECFIEGRESPVLPGEVGKKRKDQGGLLVGHFYATLNLEVGRQCIIT